MQTKFFIDIIEEFRLTDIIFLLDTNAKDFHGNVRGILELSKTLLGKSVYVHYLHANDLVLKENSSHTNSHNHNKLNVSNIDAVVQSTGTKNASTTSQVEGLSTKSAFFVISETSLMHEVVTYVSTLKLQFSILI